MTTIMPFDLSGQQMRFGITDDGRPWVAAPDFAKALGYAQAKDALRNVDADEKGRQIVPTPGGPQEITVLYEEGIWELIFLSRRKEAKELKAQVKAILRQIRETGRYEAQPSPPAQLSNRDLALMVIAEADRAEAAEQKVKELEPSAQAWDTLADANGDYSLRDAAHVLNRDPAIDTGQNRLLAKLRELGMVDRNGIPYAKHAAHLRERPTSYKHPHTGEPTLGKPQIRITVRGLRYLHQRMGGVAPLRFEQQPLDQAG